MENDELKEKIRKNIKENIAVSNIRKDISMRNIRNKRIIYTTLSACAMFIIALGIGINNNFILKNNRKENEIPKIEDETIIASEDGIQIPEIKMEESSETAQMCRAYFLAIYQGKTYTSAGRISLENAENLKGKYLGTMKNVLNDYMQSDYYKNATSTGYPYLEKFMEEEARKNPNAILGDSSGEVYEMNGYNTDFRICLIDKLNNDLIIYERLNGITLKYGKDLFEDRLKLKRKLQ